MNEAVQRLIAKTGLPEDKAETAVETVIGFLKEKLPASVASQLDGLMQGGEPGIADRLSSMSEIGTGLGGMLGRKE